MSQKNGTTKAREIAVDCQMDALKNKIKLQIFL